MIYGNVYPDPAPRHNQHPRNVRKSMIALMSWPLL
jgi:hypothetical protein